MAQMKRGYQGQYPHPTSPHIPVIQVLELLQLCFVHISTLVYSGELAFIAFLDQLQASSGHNLYGSLSLLWVMQVDKDK